MRCLKRIIKKVIDIAMAIIIFGCFICFFFTIDDIQPQIRFWLLLPLYIILFVVFLHIVLIIYEINGKYSDVFVNRCCLSYFILESLIGFCGTAFWYTSFIGLTIVDFFHFGDIRMYFLILTCVAIRNTLINSTPYHIEKLKAGNKPVKRMYNADANRILILMAYVAFLLITNNISQKNEIDSVVLIGICFTFYLAFDRLYISIVSNLPAYKEAYGLVKEEREVHLKKVNIYYKENIQDTKFGD